jgi:membrane-associated phospholipid phosphatase
MRGKCLFLFLLAMICGNLLFAQNQYDLSQFKAETGTYFTQPVRWDAYDWLKLGLVGTGTVLVYQFDQQVRTAALRNHKYANNFALQFGDQWGGFFVSPGLAVGLLVHGGLSGNRTTQKLGFEITESVLYSEAVSATAKYCIGRARPSTNKGVAAYKPFHFTDIKYNSFPAGHLDAAWALSTVLAKNTDSGLLKVIAYIPALLTATARIYIDTHWASDVFAGAALGYFVGDWVVDQHTKKEPQVKVVSLNPLTLGFDF